MPVKGSNVKFGYGDRGADGAIGTTFQDIARVTEIGGVEVESDDIDVSHMESANQFREWMAGWAEVSDLSLTLQFEKTQAATVWGLFRQDKSFRIQFKDGSKWLFNGYLKGFGTEADREGIVTLPLVVKISGEPELEPAA